MTERRIEDLAAEVLQETGANFRNFTIAHAEPMPGDALQIVFFWMEPFHLEISLILNNFDTDDSIKAQIRHQLEQATERRS